VAQPLNIGVIGTTGYPSVLIEALDRHISHDAARIAAVDDSLSTPTEKTADILNAYNAARVHGVDALLKHDGLDAVIVATSIDSHLPFTQAALEQGLAVHCEKPITATVDEAHQMIAARDAADLPVHVGFQDTYTSSIQWAKRKILDGVIGKVQRVRLQARWPRNEAYYRRNNWAGALKRGENWVLDSPAHNALAHQINVAMYLTGPDPDSSNVATSLEAELYRARDITNYDTCAIRCGTAAECDVLILLSHACPTMFQPLIEFIGEKGTIRRVHPGYCELVVDGQTVETCKNGPDEPRGPMFVNFIDRVQGRVERSMCEIENAIEVTRVINGANQCAKVSQVDERFVQVVSAGPDANADVRAIEGIDAVFDQCFERFLLPSELGDLAWATEPGKINLVGYDHFEGVPT
jgi:predicted dehydrogenase